MSSQQVELEGRGTVTLSPANHLATGGEASVYRIGDLIIKTYLDVDKMSRDGMTDKVELLKPLKTESIIAPEGVVFDKKTRKAVGFFMGFVKGEPLPRVFTTSFWQRAPFSIDQANKLVDKMRTVVMSAHKGGAVMVDANELNWLAETSGEPKPYVIDVDSWAVGKWQAQVIMQSIRDWHEKGFTPASDWFSWAVVTFQIYTGTHPYRGTLAGYKPNEWERRMKDNASVFAPGVRLPAAVRDFGEIPSALRSWYEAVFQKGERKEPPSPFAKAAAAQAAVVVQRISSTGSGSSLTHKKIFDTHPVRRLWPCGLGLVDTPRGAEVWDLVALRKVFAAPTGDFEVIKVRDGWLLASAAGGRVKAFFVDGMLSSPIEVDSPIAGRSLFRYENRLFVAADELLELEFFRGTRPTLAVKRSISILHPQATQWFDGVGVERAFAATFVVTPMRENACATVRVPELDGLHVVAGKAGKRFAAFVVEDRAGDLRRIELTFDEDHTGYRVWSGGTDSPDLNMTTLPKGVAATIVRDGELVIFVPVNGQVIRATDSTISTRMTLGNFGDTVVYVDDRGAGWSVKMK